MNPIDSIEAGDLKKGLPRLTPGDTVRVHVRVKETSVKEEIKGKPKETERERVFPLHARTIEKIEVVKQARVRRAKLYYLREKKGKAGRMKEKRAALV